jgi:hypothetical protein
MTTIAPTVQGNTAGATPALDWSEFDAVKAQLRPSRHDAADLLARSLDPAVCVAVMRRWQEIDDGAAPMAPAAVADVAPVVVAPAPQPEPAPVRRVLKKNRTTRARSRHRRWSGKLNRGVYPHYFPVPMASGLRGDARTRAEADIDALFVAMPEPCVKLYVYACRKADKDGVFDLSAPVARKLRGATRKGPRARQGGDPYLRLLAVAGLFEQVTSGGAGLGGARLASEYRLVPYAPDMCARAAAAFGAHRAARVKAVAGLDQ